MAKRQQAAAQGKGFGLLFEMGCGKTLTAIAIAGAAYELLFVAVLVFNQYFYFAHSAYTFLFVFYLYQGLKP